MHGVNINSLFVKKLNNLLNHISQHLKALGMYTLADFGFHGFKSPSFAVSPTEASDAAITKLRIHMIIFLLRTMIYLSHVTNRTLKEQLRRKIHGFCLVPKFAMLIKIS